METNKPVSSVAATQTPAMLNAECHRLRMRIRASAMSEENIREQLSWIADILIDMTAHTQQEIKHKEFPPEGTPLREECDQVSDGYNRTRSDA